MTDIQMLQDQVAGLISKGKDLRVKEAAFLKMQGLAQEIEKANAERSEIVKDLKAAKELKKDLLGKKSTAVSEAAGKIVEQMNQALPVGTAVFDCLDGLFIGWEVDGVRKPYNGLSGGEKQIFDAALEHVLGANIIILEAAELDQDHIHAALEDLAKIDKQVLINTCHPVKYIPKEFTQIELGEKVAS